MRMRRNITCTDAHWQSLNWNSIALLFLLHYIYFYFTFYPLGDVSDDCHNTGAIL
jgi:hypothetical protein